MIGEVDADGDGHIDFDEFVRLMTDHRGEAPSSAPGAGGSRSRAREKEIKASFKHFDEVIVKLKTTDAMKVNNNLVQAFSELAEWI